VLFLLLYRFRESETKTKTKTIPETRTCYTSHKYRNGLINYSTLRISLFSALKYNSLLKKLKTPALLNPVAPKAAGVPAVTLTLTNSHGLIFINAQ
jgi:hypothetical protein